MSLKRRVEIFVLFFVVLAGYGLAVHGIVQDADGDVFARFDLGTPDSGPFPSDMFTVADSRHSTGRRVAYPYPDCGERPSDCEDIAVINTLDGWGLQTQISIPFTGDIDPSSVSSDSVFVVSLDSTRPGDAPGGQRIGTMLRPVATWPPMPGGSKMTAFARRARRAEWAPGW